VKLRPYQLDAYQRALHHLESGDNPVLQLATGTGKSLIIAAIASHYEKKQLNIWILTHVQQLVGQNAIAYRKFTGDSPGIVCSGMGMANYENRVTFATVQSIRKPAIDKLIADPDLIIIDEAHRVPHGTDQATMYSEIFLQYPNAKRLGMTATPWRMDNGLIYGDKNHFIFNTLAYAYPVLKAVEEGYLSPLVGVETEYQLDLEKADVNNGDFSQLDVEELATEKWLRVVAESIHSLAHNRKHIAVYCPTIKSAMKIADMIRETTGWTVDVMTGGTSKQHRDEILLDMYAGSLRVLCSVDTITTGFDFPPLDCIVCLRPTLSSSLWVQIQGRGTRLHKDKKNCLVLDYVGNYQRLGGVDMLDSYVREVNLDVVEQVPAAEIRKPYVKKTRKLLPGVRNLVPVDPMTGREVIDGSCLTLTVNSASAVPIKTKSHSKQVLLVQYACTTVDNVRIDASTFVHTETPRGVDQTFFKNRHLAVYLPSPAAKVIWEVRNSKSPQQVSARKSGRYWNVIEELF